MTTLFEFQRRHPGDAVTVSRSGPYRKEVFPDGAAIEYGPIGMRMIEPPAYEPNEVRRLRLQYRRVSLEQAERALASFRHAGSALDQGGMVMQFSAPRWNDSFGPPPLDEHGEQTLAACVARLRVIVQLRKAALAREERTGKTHWAERELRDAEADLKAARQALARLERGERPESVWSHPLADSLGQRPEPMTAERVLARVKYLVRVRGERVVRLEKELLEEQPATPEREVHCATA
jgi:hypothetical protein